MNKSILFLFGALSLAACSKERPAEDIHSKTTTRSGELAPATVEEVRTVLLEKKPGASETINALVISSDNGLITLRGKVEDEQVRSELVNRVRSMPNVRGVKDELHASPHAMRHGHEKTGEVGTTTTTGAREPTSEGAGTAPSTGTPTAPSTTGGATATEPHGKMSKSDAVRHSMKKAHPKSETIIDALTITEDGSIIMLSGTVPDEPTHRSLVKAAKETPGVKNVKDDIKIQPKK